MIAQQFSSSTILGDVGRRFSTEFFHLNSVHGALHIENMIAHVEKGKEL